jgi:hypothetical protein
VIDYMAPELTDSGDADERADLYSLEHKLEADS